MDEKQETSNSSTSEHESERKPRQNRRQTPDCEPNHAIRSISRPRRFWTAVLLGLGLAVTFAANAGRMLIVDEPAKSDVILVLAGETEHRPERGLELLRQGYGRTLVVDVPAAAKVYGFSETQLASDYFHRVPQSADIRVCPIDGLSTRDEAHDAEKCLTSAGGDRVLLVTSEFHTRRAVSIFRHEVPGRSFSVVAAYDSTQFGTHWWQHRQWAKTLLDEWLRLLWWNAVDRWRVM